LFSTITKCVYIYFQIQNLEKKLVVADKELQRARKDNQTLDRYINAKRKKKETQKKEKKAQKRRRRRPARRLWTSLIM
jgi:predicted Holliday junction resolvase-like endonuclease